MIPIKKEGWFALDNVYEGDFFETEDDFYDIFKLTTGYECPECGEVYQDEDEASSCCEDE